MRRIAVPWVAIAAALTLAVAACGDDDAGEGGPAEIEATGSDFLFSPDLWSVSAGEQVTITFTNVADQEHTWVILSDPIAAETDFSEGLVLFEASADAGTTVSESFAAPQAGTYQVICSVVGHFAAGMEGELTVEG